VKIAVTHRSWRCCLAAGAVLLLGLAGPGALSAGCSTEPVDRFHALEIQLNEFYRAVDVALDLAPVEEFDVAARQAVIGDDPAALFAWVRDHTRLLPYQGALRGGLGTLLDRSGSHLDRALLLAALLEEADYEVRLGRATLDDAALARLPDLTKPLLGRPANAASAAGVPPALARRLNADPDAMTRQVRALEAHAEDFAQQVANKVAAQSRALATHLEAYEPASDDADARHAALADHWWVQVRRGSGWQDLDPSLPEHQAGERLHDGAVETIWPDELPADVQHRLSIEVVAERLDNRRLREDTALSHEVAAMDLPGKPFPLELHPLGMPDAAGVATSGSHDALGRQLIEERQWIPFLVIDGESITDKIILANGTVADQGIRSAQAEAMEEASGMLGQLGRGADRRRASTELTAVFLRLTVAAPGRPEKTFERSLMDMLGPDRRAGRGARNFEFTDTLREARALGMFSSTEMLVQRSWWPAEYAVGHLLYDVGLNRQAVLGAVHAIRRDSPALIGAAVERMAMAPSDLVTLAFARRALSPHAEAVALTSMNLITVFENITASEDGPVLTRGFDIIDNRVDVIGASGAEARRIRLDQGVLDTVLEAELLVTEGAVVNTSLDYGEALAAGRSWLLIDRLDAVDGLAPDTAAHVGQALAGGHRAVLPADPAAGAPVTWWRVDPATGATLGLGPDGRGQMTDAIITQWKAINTASSAVSFTLSVWQCLIPDKSPEAMQCCIKEAGAKVLVNKGLGKLYETRLEIIGLMPESKVYQLAVSEAIGKASGAGVNELSPGC